MKTSTFTLLSNRKKQKNSNINFIVIVLCFVCSFELFSAENLVPLNKLKQIKVVTEYFAPYQIKNEDGSLGGFATEIIYAIFNELALKPHIQPMAWARAYDLSIKEENILIYSIVRNPERENLFHWVGNISNEKSYLWGIKSKFIKPIDNINQLKSYSITAVRNGYDHQYLLDNHFEKIYLTVTDDQKMFMLYRNRIDLLIGSDKTVKWRSKHLSLNINDIKQLIAVPDFNINLNLAFSLKTNKETVLLFKNAFDKIKKNGTYHKIEQKWGL